MSAPDLKIFDEPPLLVLRSVAKAVGLNDAIALQQIHYRTRAGGWWEPTADELAFEFAFWSRQTRDRVLASIVGRGLVEVAGRQGARRYRVDRDAWLAFAVQIERVRPPAMSRLDLVTGSDVQIGPVPIKPLREGTAREDTRARALSNSSSDLRAETVNRLDAMLRGQSR